MSPTVARNVAATITLTPGTVISLHVGPAQGVQRDQALDLGDRCVQKRDVAQAGVDGLALLQ